MIQKISLYNLKNNAPVSQEKDLKNEKNEFNYVDRNIELFSPSGKFLHSYIIPFKANDKLNEKYSEVMEGMSPKAQEIYTKAEKLARKYNHKEIEQIHFLKVFIDSFIDIIEKMDDGDLDALEPTIFGAPEIMTDIFGPDIFHKPPIRKKFKALLKTESAILSDKLKEMPKAKTPVNKLKLSKNFLNDVYNIYKIENTPDEDTGAIEGTGAFEDEYFFKKIILSSSSSVKKELSDPFFFFLSKSLKVHSNDNPVPLKFLEDRAKKVWKNLSVGTNMFILYEPGMNDTYMLDTFENVLKTSKDGIGRFNTKNTEINRYNDRINADFLISEIKRGMKDKSKNHIYVFNYQKAKNNNSDMDIFNVEKYLSELINSPNMKFVIVADKDKYYDNLSGDPVYKNFSQVSIPIINPEQTKKIFRSEKGLTKDFESVFTSKAIDKIVDITESQQGFYPEKAKRIMTLISNYYSGKKEITSKDVVNYINEAKEIFKTQDKDETSVNVILNTGLRLDDIIGLRTTKKEAASIVNQIKNHSIGTKGFIIYSHDGTPGAGRNYTARAIAGEAKIPFLEINAVDFGTKDVNIFGDSSTTPEAAMKKLFSMAKTQAETNRNKALVLYIQNFEYFSCGSQVSEYHEKAMSQLLKEMEIAQKQGLNIVVIGSVANPNMLGESTLKSFKFVDKIEVESPAMNKKARKELIEYYLKKKNIKLNAKDSSEKTSLIEKFAELTEYMSLIEIMTILDKVKNVSMERNHNLTDKSDFIEALLQIQCGRPAQTDYDKYSKAVIASHECGHALNGTIMNEITTGMKPWLGSAKVSFITLDPRGDFGGMVSSSEIGNFTYTFENVFADLVADFGGYSGEKYFYGIDGSWGISQDMNQATNMATKAAAVMGVGHFFGKKSLGGVMFEDVKDKTLINQDVEVFLHNAQIVSDLIMDEYSDFVKQFTDKYADKVGTGECIVPGEEFRTSLNEWRKSLPEQKQQDLITLNEIIKEIMSKTQNDVKY